MCIIQSELSVYTNDMDFHPPFGLSTEENDPIKVATYRGIQVIVKSISNFIGELTRKQLLELKMVQMPMYTNTYINNYEYIITS